MSRASIRCSTLSRRCTGASGGDVVEACERAAVTALAGVAREEEGDTIYAIDRVAEHVLVEEIARTIATADAPVVLVAEGLAGGEVTVPDGRRSRAAPAGSSSSTRSTARAA